MAIHRPVPVIIFPSESHNDKQSYSKDSNFEHDDYGQEPPKERSLWQSVITQAIVDATCAPVNARTRREKTQSIIWLSMQNKDFLMVCELADMNPSRIIKGTKKLIKQSTVNHRRKLRMRRMNKIYCNTSAPCKKSASCSKEAPCNNKIAFL